MTDMTAEQAFKHLYQLCWNLPANDEHAAHELIDFLRQALTTPRVPNGETVTFWVVYDVTTDKKYIKKNADTGALAMFDYEHEALAVSLAHPGTGYRQVTYIKTDAAPAPAEPICKHCGNPTMHVGDVCYGCCQSTSEPTIAETFKRIGREIKIDDAKIMAMVDARYDAPAPADVNYVDAFNGDVPFPAPGQSLVDALRERLESSDTSPQEIKQRVDLRLENIKLRERVKVLEAQLEPDMFWWADDPEHAAAYDLEGLCDQIFDNNLTPSDGTQLANVRLAASLPDAVLEARVVERDGDFYWEARLRGGSDE